MSGGFRYTIIWPTDDLVRLTPPSERRALWGAVAAANHEAIRLARHEADVPADRAQDRMDLMRGASLKFTTHLRSEDSPDA